MFEKKIKVLQILPSMESGGVERGVLEISKALKKDEGFIPSVISGGGKLVAQLKNLGIEHITIPVDSKNPIMVFLSIIKLTKLIQEEAIDIIHARSRMPAWIAYFACKKTDCKLVTTVHGNYSFRKDLFGNLKKLYNSSMFKGERIIAVSNFIKKSILRDYEIARKNEKKICVIHRGVDIDIFNPDKISIQRILIAQKKLSMPDGKKIIMLPGRLTSWKGQEFLIDALKKVKDKNYFCIMIGDDKGHKTYRKRLERKIIENGLADCVRIKDESKDMPATYMLSDIVISASTRPEAFGRVAVEAQAMKRSVIVTAIGGSLETITNKETGWLVEPDNAEKFAQVIDMVLSMKKEELDRVAENAYNYVRKNFSIEKMCNKTISLYKELISQK